MTNAQSALGYTLWLLLNDEEFLRLNEAITPDVFPRGSGRFLAGLALDNWSKNHTLVGSTVVELATEGDTSALRKAGAQAAQAASIYVDICSLYAVDAIDLPATRAICTTWLERRTMQVAIDKATAALGSGDMAGARSHLGSAELIQHALSKSVTLNVNTPDFLKAMRTPKVGAIPTGFADLDKAWDGGYRPGELGMVVAPTGVGKTMALCAMAARAAWEGANVLFYTYELTPEQIKDRISLAILERGRGSLQDEWDVELLRAAIRRGNTTVPPFDVDVRNDAQTWPALVASLEEYKRKWTKYPDVLFLDSPDDIAPMFKREKSYEALRDAYTYLRLNILEAKGIRGWTSGQVNRDGIDKAAGKNSVHGGVTLRFIGDAFAKAQKSHYVLAFAQSQVDKQVQPDPEIQLYVLKDSLWGTTGAWLQCSAKFGAGSNGYAGFEIDNVYNLPGGIT